MLILTVVTILSASAGGYFYYSSLKKTAFIRTEQQAYNQLRTTQKSITSFLSGNIKPVRTLAGMPEIKAALSTKDQKAISKANLVLDHFNTTLEAEACYLLDTDGLTLASSNRNSPDSFVGINFSFRPYFKKAMMGSSATYLALGTTSHRRGVYCSYPVFHPSSIEITGAVVIKASIERIEHDLLLSPTETIILTDPNGLIFISTRADWLFKLFNDVPESTRTHLTKSRQFGTGPWPSNGLKRLDSQHFIDSNETLYFSVQSELDNYPNWTLLYLKKLPRNPQLLPDTAKITGPLIFILCLSIGTAVFLMYLKAFSEISKRKSAQAALIKSEKRYRHLYEKTPAMLHSIDTDGKILGVSDYWLKTMGYTHDEVSGKALTDFYTESSRTYAQEVVIPSFFKDGFCNEIPYQFIKKDGKVIDILLSAIAERDDNDRINRSLAVSVDVTERNKAQNALQLAKEELSHYSLELEKEIQERTLEINSILTNTPDVIYMVDQQGKFKLVNKKFEEIFSVANCQTGDKTIFDLVGAQYAQIIHDNNIKVFFTKSPVQIEEQIPTDNGDHTYLSVKFPIYDHKQQIDTICSISTDVTELYKAQGQLRRLSASIMENQEKERTAIARELHDELGQVLTALRMEAVSLHDRLCIDDHKGSERARQMCKLIDNTIDDVRGMATRLRPGVLDDLGLFDALEWYTEDFERRSGITCFFTHKENNVLLPAPLTTAAYRITQEALTNASRYSGANNIDVTLKVDEHFLLMIKDNGRGFETSLLKNTKGLGIAGMQERAALAGGTLSVESSIVNGTTITFQVNNFLAQNAII